MRPYEHAGIHAFNFTEAKVSTANLFP